jgi:adenylate kinase
MIGKPLYIILFGPPMAGKGTLASRIATKLKLPHIDAGRTVRKRLKNSPELLAHVNAGNLLSDEMICEIIGDQLAPQTTLVDGFPRSIGQAQHLYKHTEKHDIAALLIRFDLPLSIGLQRMRKRVICGKCGLPHNNKNAPCNSCGAHDWQHRADDRAEVLAHRYESYNNYSREIFQYYQELKTPCITVDTALSLEILTQSLCATITKHIERS